MIVSSIKHLAFLLKCKSSEDELIKICLFLSNKEFVFDKQFYKEWIKITELKNGKLKTRIINPSTGRLKLIQSRIKKNILEKIDFPRYVQGSIKGCSNITNAVLHLGNKFKFTTDIKGFFPSIKPSQVYESLCKIGFKPEVSRIITILTTYKGRVPQGAATSAHIANLVFLPIDEKINNYCIQEGIIYTRYIDDITLSSTIDFKERLPIILSYVSDNGFKISARKTQYKHIIDITGISTGNNVLKPNKKFYKKLEEDQSDSCRQGRLKYLERVKTFKKPKKFLRSEIVPLNVP